MISGGGRKLVSGGTGSRFPVVLRFLNVCNGLAGHLNVRFSDKFVEVQQTEIAQEERASPSARPLPPAAHRCLQPPNLGAVLHLTLASDLK